MKVRSVWLYIIALAVLGFSCLVIFNQPDTGATVEIDLNSKELIRTRVESFITLDASFNTADAISRIEEAKKYLTEGCYESVYLNNGRFMSLPLVSSLPKIIFIDSSVEKTLDGYKVLILWSETLDDRLYTYTGVLVVSDDGLIDGYRKIPHLK